ncbi:MAG TPA: porin, partial [Clostridia bacterium]|nr:porin [Clostridia bacterium]
MGRTKRFLLAGLLVLGTSGSSLMAQESAPSYSAEDLRVLRQKIEELEQKVRSLEATRPAAETTNQQQIIEDLDQKVKILERNRELEQEAAAAKASEAPRLTVGERGFSFASANTNFVLQLRGLAQVDTRIFFDDGGTVGNTTFLLRRLRPILQGTVFRDFDFLFAPDFGGSGSPQIVDAYVNYRLRPELQLQIGKLKVPVGLEQLQSDTYTFFSERGLPTTLVPNRDLGFQLHGNLFRETLSYQVGVFNGVGDARSSSNVDFDDNKSVAARLFFQPFKNSTHAFRGLRFGVAGSWEDLQTNSTTGLPSTTGGSLSGYATPVGQQYFAYNPSTGTVLADGEHWRLSPQAYWYYGPFGLLAEYVVSEQKVRRFGPDAQSARLANTAWQVAASWVLTGEEATFSGVQPRRSFNPLEGRWGALQLVARYGQVDIDPDAFPLFANPETSARRAHEYGLGLNWYLNRNLRVNASYSHTYFTGGGGSGGSAPAIV